MKTSTRTLVQNYTLLSLLLAAGPAAASPDGFGLGLHGAYGESKNADDGSGLIGAHAEIRPASALGILGSIGYKMDEQFAVTVGGDEGFYEVHSVPLTLAARLYFPMQGFAPFASAGAQWRYITYDYGGLDDAIDNFQADESETAFGWILGAGAEFSTSSNVGLFGEARWEFVDAERDLGDFDFDRVEDFDYDQWQVMGGITFYMNSGE